MRDASSAPQLRLPIQVVVPLYGVRAQVAHDHVRVAIADDGGRGAPWQAVFIPVQPDGDRLVLVDHNGTLIRDPKLSDFDRLIEDKWPWHADGWYQFNVTRERWPQSPYGVLVLLFYFQAKGIGIGGGGDAQAANYPLGPLNPKDDPNWQHAFERVAEHLRDDPLRDLLPGVLRVSVPARPLAGLVRGPAPAPQTTESITFALASCQYPGDLLDRSPRFSQTSGDGPADASLMRLAARLDTPDDALRPRFLLLAGDQIYADATAGMFDPTVRDDIYRNSYQGFFGSRGALSVFNRLPVFMMLDDHEIADNWEPGPSPENDNQALLCDGRAAYVKHQRDAGPPLTDANDPAVLWACIEPEGLPIFMADTRTRREARSAPGFQTASIVDEPQFKRLTDWLLARKYAARPSFVVSPSMLLPRPLGLAARPASALHCDAWAGYPRSLHRLLAFLCDHEIGNAVFLSGDEHLSCVAQVSVARKAGGSKIELRSIHSSALYAPYPFANAVPEDFARLEEFEFKHPMDASLSYVCTVNTEYPQIGDGFALVSVATLASGAWRVEVLFDRAQFSAAQYSFSFSA